MIIALQTLIFFRQTLLSALDRLLGPYYKRLTLTFSRYSPEDEDEDEEVFAEFDDEKGVVFYPPMYVQRYAAVSDCLMDERWCGKLEKVVDLGYHDMSFIKYLKEVQGIRCIMGVDIESIPLRCSSELLGCEEYAPKRESPLQVTLFQGNAADPDYRLIGCDAVIAIEMIEHMLPHDLDRLVHTVFGFIKPWIAIFTTPNSDFNTLFKSLEKNGLRRLDHFFEWSREQFHDWCSNIVTRYPQFTVTCLGIGPGPPGTQHHGCCSQLALFINKDYVKQQDLNINSLALVSNVPSPHNITDIIGGWESPINDPENLIYPDNNESLTDFMYSNKQSCVTIVITSPAFSLPALEYRDKTSQCNLDSEFGKNFLMFNEEEMCISVLVPRRKMENRVYEIEDVNSRLNCTTFQIRKFSKTTQNLMAKNKVDSLIHTREVVNEIRHLTKMLNFNKEALTQKAENGHVWCNINWGDDAPYWNQYYKVVREFNYPFETKSDECRILDLISEEINRMIDAHCDEEFSTDVNKLEIPMDHLMRVVRHITNDVEKVKHLLEWNGYEIVGNVVIHSRMVVDGASMGSCDDDWPENDTISDLDTTDIHSTSISDGSTIAADYHGRCLLRALDKKVRELRTMLSADEDITSELDRVVCRLMKLALRSSKGKQTPPPTRWMQCKLLDLLTLTEKAISRRRKHYLDGITLKALGYHGREDPTDYLAVERLKKDDRTVRNIMNKYNHLIEVAEIRQTYDPLGFGFEDDLGDQESNDFFKDFEFSEVRYSFQTESIVNNTDEKFTREQAQAWIEENNLEIVPYPDHTKTVMSSSDQSTSNGVRHRHKKSRKRGPKAEKPPKRSHSKIQDDKSNADDQNKNKKSKTSLVKTVARKKSASSNMARNYGKKLANEFRHYGIKSKRVIKEHKKLQPTASKPIPGSLIELCHPELNTQNSHKRSDRGLTETYYSDVAATEESVLIDIIMDDMEETIALRRSIGTDADMDFTDMEQEEVLSNVENMAKDDSIHVKLQTKSENVQSQTIFLNDINEPSTSKGVRHVSMDVQCGTDSLTPATYGTLTPPSSVTKIPNVFSNGIRIGNSLTNVASKNNGLDFESSNNNDIQNFGPVSSRIKPIFAKGIKIEDSPDNLFAKRLTDLSTSTDDHDQSPATRTTKIKINDLSFDIIGKCGTSTRHPSEKGTLSPILKSSGVMTDEIIANDSNRSHESAQALTKGFAGDELNDLKSDFRSKKNIDFGMSPNDIAKKIATLTARPESPDAFTRNKRNDSLTNILSNFNTFVNRRCYTGRGSPPGRSPIRYSTGIRIHDSIPEIGNTSDIGAMEKAKDKYRESEMCRIISPRVKSPVIFKYKAKKSLSGTGSSHTDVGTYTNEKDSKQVEQSSEVSGSLTDLTKYKSSCETNEETSHSADSPGNIKFGDYFSDMKQNNADTYTNAMKCVNRSLSLSPKTISFGIKVKDFDANVIKKLEISTTRVELMSDCQPYLSPKHLESPTKTELLKPVSSAMKTEDSCSEYCGSNYYSPLRVTNSSINTSDLRVKESSSRDVPINNSVSPTRALRRKLSCGGIHIHSYKEKQVCEDIVYQGEWQRQVPQISRKKMIPVIMKKVPEKSMERLSGKKEFPRDRTQLKKQDKKLEEKIEQKKFAQVRNMKSVKLKQEVVNKTEHYKKVTRSNLAKSTKTKNTNSSIPTLIKTVKVNNKNVTKVSSKITMSSVPPKNTRNVHIAKKPTTSVSSYMKKDFDNKTEPIKRKDFVKKSYLPPYLRKKKLISNQSNLNQSFNSANTIIKVNKDSAKERLAPLIRPINEDLKTDLIKYHNIPYNDISYIVFRNELEKSNLNVSNSQTADNTTKTETINRRTNSNNRSSSPMSQNSSTCSTPDSIATVRAMSTRSKVSTRRHSTSSNKSSIGNTDSETVPPVRNRKLTKRIKTNKKSDVKDNNKENLPESSTTCPEKGLQIVKSAFMGRSKNVFMAQFATDSNIGLNIKHQTPTKSSVKIPAIESNEDKKRPKTANISKKKSSQSNDSSDRADDIKNQGSPISEGSNMVFLLEPCTQFSTVQESISQAATSEEQVDVVKVVDSNLLTEWLESGNAVDRDNTEKAILAAMRQIVEERLNFIDSTTNEAYAVETTSTFDENIDIDDSSSLKSYKTVILTSAGVMDLNSTLNSEIENVMNHSLDAITGDESGTSLGYETGTNELDLLSFKSISSTPRYSEYFSADNERTENNNTDNSSPRLETSVRDIFERKDLNFNQPTPGVLAVQAFSGFSMNAEPVVGDQPDYVNLVDSETGSVAADFTRLATSEELFVSGRSSESYESCVIDEDAVVPNWLFNIMNHQQSVDEEEEEEDHQELVPLPMPLVDPVYDVNGNVVEPGIGLGAGAGDGRGMHSDHSQDSSGRGSSLSTTDTSSGQQSEAILIDPSAFTAQFELLHEPISSSMAVTTLVVPVESPEALALRQGNEGQLSSIRTENVRMPDPLLLTSDGEADVSSLDTDIDAPGDTDVPESSDN